MGFIDYIKKFVKAFSDSDSYYKDLSKEDGEQLKEAERIRERDAREAYLQTPEGQEELRQEKIKNYMSCLGRSIRKGSIGNTAKTLEKLLAIAKECEFPDDYIQDCIYSAGKQAAANVYDKKGVNPDNIEKVIGDVAEAYKKLLAEDIDKDEYGMYVNKTVIEDLLEFLRDLPPAAKIDDAENAVDKVKELLRFTDYSEEKIRIRQKNLSRLLGANYLKHMEKLAEEGDAENYDCYREKMMKLLEQTGNTPEQVQSIALSIDKNRIKCYQNNYSNAVVSFAKGDISISELRQCTTKNNQAVKESLMPERLKPMYTRFLSPNAYREELDRLIYNLKFVENKSQFRSLSKEIRRCVKPANLSDEERASLEKTLTNINSIFKRVKKPELKTKKNPNFKREVRTKLENIQNNLEEIAKDEDCFKKDKSVPNSFAYAALKELLDASVLNNGHRRPPTKKEIVHAISKVESNLLNPEYRESLYLEEVWSLQLKVADLKEGDALKRQKNEWGQNGNQKNTDKRRFFDRRMQRFTKKSR